MSTSNRMGAAWCALFFALVFVALFLVGLALGLTFGPKAHAHDSWIGRGGLRNAAGEWCCGDNDCFALAPGSVALRADGYHLLDLDEVVPFAEAQPSPDGAYWRCKRPDGSRRCFFAPPPNS
jgi:hypothetical protein